MINCDSLDCFAPAFGIGARNDKLLIGIADAISLDYELANLKRWLENNYNGEMGWIARNVERRCNPLNVLPECKSVIVAAMKYDEMPKHEDYHKVMMRKMEAIVAEIKKEEPTAMCKCYVDTGPVLEKAWAARAGIGFIGKNTLLISPEHGSQMALGVVLTDVEVRSRTSEVGRQTSDIRLLTSDFRFPTSLCGSCRKCLDACPTGALVEPYILDARRCISYKYFVESKRASVEFTSREREGYGGKERGLASESFPPYRIKGGCDICQDVCPYNKENVIARSVSDEAISRR
ncbi:MAG: DUF1730 domain-containing protein [Deltaproteobacteria bacterium]|nr:DUF1730 domain-containing protein [Deltaproteobacteria bacterium]